MNNTRVNDTLDAPLDKVKQDLFPPVSFNAGIPQHAFSVVFRMLPTLSREDGTASIQYLGAF